MPNIKPTDTTHDTQIYYDEPIKWKDLYAGRCAGYDCKVRTNGHYPVVYLRIPEGHKLFMADEKKANDVIFKHDLEPPHDWFTFSGPMEEGAGDWWLGWDFAHPGDYLGGGLKNPKDAKRYTMDEIMLDALSTALTLSIIDANKTID